MGVGEERDNKRLLIGAKILSVYLFIYSFEPCVIHYLIKIHEIREQAYTT